MEISRQFLGGDGPESLGITNKRPKYPQYAVISKRKESFANWPAHAVIPADQLAECGLVYTGVGDSVRCYYCGGGLRNWEPEDDPWVEHATWYPDCPHVHLVKGQGFIDRVINNSLESDGPLVAEVQTTENVLNTVAALSCLQMGYPEDKVLKAINKFISKHGNSNFKGEQICEILLDEEDEMSTNVSDSHTDSACASKDVAVDISEPDQPRTARCTEEDTEHESLEELVEENCRLKQSQLCKICLDGTASIIFLPCAHMVTCPQCAPAFTKCPICRMAVNGFVKAFFSHS